MPLVQLFAFECLAYRLANLDQRKCDLSLTLHVAVDWDFITPAFRHIMAVFDERQINVNS